ncbi:MAG: hypothetical protein WAO98_05375 [Alphaproteobacteria bacterium]
MNVQALALKLPEITQWIDKTLADYSSQAKIVSELRFPRLPQFYSENLLANAKVVPVTKVPVPPLSQLGLTEFVAFEAGNYNGITYKDTYFVQEDLMTNEALHFHELVHVVQWMHLGVDRFLLTYAVGLARYGYRDSPLEMVAYSLQEYFQLGGEPKNVEAIIRSEADRL